MRKKETSFAFADEVGEIVEDMNVGMIEKKFQMRVDEVFDFSGDGKLLPTYIGGMWCWKCGSALNSYNDGKMESEVQALIKNALGKDGKYTVLCDPCKKDVAAEMYKRNFNKHKCKHWIRNNLSSPYKYK